MKIDLYKWNFAIGTTSRVPGSRFLHYLILDIDNGTLVPNKTFEILDGMSNYNYQYTEHGIHIYTNFIATFLKCSVLAKKLGADPKWISIAERRGYFYLADKNVVKLPWPVERMIIYRGKKES